MKLPDISKFSLAEMTSNPDGKTSSSGVMGCIIIAVGCTMFILGCVDKVFVTHILSTDILNHSIAVIGMGTAMLTVREDKILVCQPSFPLCLHISLCQRFSTRISSADLGQYLQRCFPLSR